MILRLGVFSEWRVVWAWFWFFWSCPKILITTITVCKLQLYCILHSKWSNSPSCIGYLKVNPRKCPLDYPALHTVSKTSVSLLIDQPDFSWAQINRLISGNIDYVFCLPDLLMILRCLSADPHHKVEEVESIYKNILNWGHVFCLCPGCCSDSMSTMVICFPSGKTLLGAVVWLGKGEGRPWHPPAALMGSSRVVQGSSIPKPAPMPWLRVLMGLMG